MKFPFIARSETATLRKVFGIKALIKDFPNIVATDRDKDVEIGTAKYPLIAKLIVGHRGDFEISTPDGWHCHLEEKDCANNLRALLRGTFATVCEFRGDQKASTWSEFHDGSRLESLARKCNAQAERTHLELIGHERWGMQF